MSTEILPFKAKHIEELLEQEAMKYLKPYLPPEHYPHLESQPYSYTMRVDGRTIACAGVVEYWKGRAEAWAVLDANCKREFMGLHNAVKRFLEVCPIRRIEAVVDANFHAGHRWVKALGFELEAPVLKSYHPDGRSCSLYARVS